MNDGTQADTQDASISLRKSVTLYFAFITLLVILINLVIKTTWFPGWGALLGYLVCGFILNRIVLRRLVEWHPMHNTLSNVSQAKLSSLLLWPLSYPVLFFRLGVDRIL